MGSLASEVKLLIYAKAKDNDPKEEINILRLKKELDCRNIWGPGWFNLYL